MIPQLVLGGTSTGSTTQCFFIRRERVLFMQIRNQFSDKSITDYNNSWSLRPASLGHLLRSMYSLNDHRYKDNIYQK